jgi:hypothetical protein
MSVSASERASAGMLGTVQGSTQMRNSIAKTSTRTAVSVSRRQRKIIVMGTPQMMRKTMANFSSAMTLLR